MRYEAKTEPEAVEAAARALGKTAAEIQYRVIRDEKSFWGGRVVEIEVEGAEETRLPEAGSREPEPDESETRSRGLRDAADGAGSAAARRDGRRGGRARRVDADGASVGGRPSRRDQAAPVLERRAALRALRRRRRASARQQRGGPDRSRGPGGAHRVQAPRPTGAPAGSTPRVSARTGRRRSRSSPASPPTRSAARDSPTCFRRSPPGSAGSCTWRSPKTRRSRRRAKGTGSSNAWRFDSRAAKR